MLNYKIINYKPTIKRNGITFLDLMGNNFTPVKGVNGDFIIVNKYYVARPDLISLAVYQTDSYADIICKVNGISNPFELNEDDILFLPHIDYIANCVKYTGNTSELIESGDDEIKKNTKTNNKKKFDEIRGSNELIEGEDNFVINKSMGLVFY